MDYAQILSTIAVYALPVLFAITIHEAAHGYAAQYFGDNTAAMLGRITLNPIKHIDPIGTIALPLFLYFVTSGNFLFGYAKPVPVRFDKLHNPKRDMVWVAFAGPASNFAQAVLWGLFAMLLSLFGVTDPFLLKMAQGGVLVNIVMFALNLFPLPPLDGGRILVGLLPPKAAYTVSRIEPYGFFIVMGLIVAGVLSTLWMQPVMRLTYALVNVVLSPIRFIIG
jgi:Zn-dependent protease